MPFSSLFRKSAPSPTNAAIIELIYAGNDMAAHLVMKDGRDFSCVCGMIVGPVENPSHHHTFCPVARFYRSVEMVKRALALAFVVLFLSQVGSAQLPEAPKSHLFDRTDWTLLSLDASARTLDTISTRLMLTAPCRCNHEMFLPPFIANHTAVLAVYGAGIVGVNIFAAHELKKHGHPRLAKVILAVDAVQDAPWAIHNLFLPSNQIRHKKGI